MNAAARARAALILLTAASAALWAAAVFDHMSARDDLTDLAAAVTVTVSTVVGICSRRAAAQREQLRESYQRDRVAYTRMLEAQLSQPHDGGDGQAQPRPEHPRWYLRVPA